MHNRWRVFDKSVGLWGGCGKGIKCFVPHISSQQVSKADAPSTCVKNAISPLTSATDCFLFNETARPSRHREGNSLPKQR